MLTRVTQMVAAAHRDL